jgi:sugar lactone lactonase YvrE
VTAGTVKKGDVLVDNFNNSANFQGMGSTIIDYNPATQQTTTFASIPQNLPGCPGGVGLSTAMAMLKSGWVIVGSAPSTDGTPKTRGDGCLIVLNASGKVQGTISGPEISDPWGNMAVIDLAIAAGKPPEVTKKTVIADGFGAQADASVFLIGPTGLSLGKNGTLYVSDAIGNRVVAIADAATRIDSAGTGREVTKGGFLQRPLAMDMAANGNLLVVNGLDGNVVEIDPFSGKQIGVRLIDGDEAQTPPGSGDLFGIVMRPDGKGFYYVEDDVNTLVEAQ